MSSLEPKNVAQADELRFSGVPKFTVKKPLIKLISPEVVFNLARKSTYICVYILVAFINCYCACLNKDTSIPNRWGISSAGLT